MPDAIVHHAVRVLRLEAGAALVLFDGEGAEAHGELLRKEQRWVVRVRQTRCIDRESPLRLILVQALASADKMDWVVQKAVELGVLAVHPLAAERSVLRLEGARADKRLEHWRQIAIAACAQCGRNRVPEIAPVRTLAAWLAEHPAGDRRVLAPGGAALAAGAPPDGDLALLVGPEGGWSAAEMTRMQAAGCQMVALGPRVLRTETAGLAAVAAVQAWWGDFACHERGGSDGSSEGSSDGN